MGIKIFYITEGFKEVFYIFVSGSENAAAPLKV
jgi:hypothetical protein